MPVQFRSHAAAKLNCRFETQRADEIIIYCPIEKYPSEDLRVDSLHYMDDHGYARLSGQLHHFDGSLTGLIPSSTYVIQVSQHVSITYPVLWSERHGCDAYDTKHGQSQTGQSVSPFFKPIINLYLTMPAVHRIFLPTTPYASKRPLLSINA